VIQQLIGIRVVIIA